MDDDDEVRIVDQPTTSSSLNKREKRPATSRNKNPVSSDKAERAGFKRRQDGKVVEMMGWFLELKEKQAEKVEMMRWFLLHQKVEASKTGSFS